MVRDNVKTGCVGPPTKRRLPDAGAAVAFLRQFAPEGPWALTAISPERNGIENTKFLTADLMQPDWSFLRESWDLVILDPPRTGAEAVVAQIGVVAPKRIVYVSCHPATLARDAKVLVERHHYRLSSTQVFDMFPHTHHVEVMAFFERG